MRITERYSSAVVVFVIAVRSDAAILIVVAKHNNLAGCYIFGFGPVGMCFLP